MATQLVAFVVQHKSGKYYSLGATRLVTLKNASQFTQQEAIFNLKFLNQLDDQFVGYAPIYYTTKGVLYS